MSAVQRTIEEVTDTQVAPAEQDNVTKNSSLGVALMRITLGVIILATWWGNITADPNFYSSEGLIGFFDWAFTPAEDGGNGASLGFIEAIIDNTVLQAPGFFGLVQSIVEPLIGLGLVFGVATRLNAALAFAFFVGLFLTYFGGEEWIWTYVLLMAGAVTTFVSWGGRTLGVDRAIAAVRGDSPGKLIW